MPRFLFICKKRVSSYGEPIGLFNSANLTAWALSITGIDTKVVTVIDNNSIDREVHQYKPSHVIIEALWVVPEKFNVLVKLHPFVEWFVRVHSKVPFLAMEGIAIEWLRGYQQLNEQYSTIHVAFNNITVCTELAQLGFKSIYLPNIYPMCDRSTRKDLDYFIDIGCFGAIRPFKNHLLQALAAIKFANDIDKLLRFHVNSNRIEQHGEPILKNLRSTFADGQHVLVEHPWLAHNDFLGLVSSMDMGMQVSYSESYNVVSADFVAQHVPIVVSKEVRWMPFWTKSEPNSMSSIVHKMHFIWDTRTILPIVNLLYLKMSNHRSLQRWLGLIAS